MLACFSFLSLQLGVRLGVLAFGVSPKSRAFYLRLRRGAAPLAAGGAGGVPGGTGTTLPMQCQPQGIARPGRASPTALAVQLEKPGVETASHEHPAWEKAG